MSEEFQSFFNVISGTRFKNNLRNITEYILNCLSQKYPNIEIKYNISSNHDFYFVLEDISDNNQLHLIDNRIVISLHSGNIESVPTGSQSHLHEGSSYNGVPIKNRLDLKIKFKIIPSQNNSGQIEIKYPRKSNPKQIYIDFILCLQYALNQNPRIFTTITHIGTPTPFKNKKKYIERPEFIIPKSIEETKSDSEVSSDDSWTPVKTKINRKISYELKYIKYKLKYLKLKEKIKYIK